MPEIPRRPQPDNGVETRQKKQKRDESPSPEIDKLQDLRQKNLRYREHAKIMEKPDKSGESTGEPGEVRELMQHYHRINNELETIMKDNLYCILSEDQLTDFHSDFAKIGKAIDTSHEAYMNAGEELDRKEKEGTRLGPAKTAQNN